jgi:hypothetical protein
MHNHQHQSQSLIDAQDQLTSLHSNKNTPIQKRSTIDHARHKARSQQAIIAVLFHHRPEHPTAREEAWLLAARVSMGSFGQ